MFKIGDYVTRNSYGNDVIFKIIEVKDSYCYLSGVSVRLFADSPYEDLVKYSEDKVCDDFEPDSKIYDFLDRNDYFYLPGTVLHIDGDKEYLSTCMEYYKKNKVKAYGFFFAESDIKNNIFELLNKYNPDILVITGHDAFYKKRKNDELEYKNSKNFCDAVREARKFERSHDKLLIIAGACQSNYDELIKSGANFASSPKRINIHALDPAVIACLLAFSNKNENIKLIDILSKTKYGKSGVGGIITNGTMYVGYPR